MNTFISYHRDDTGPITGHIAHRLRLKCGDRKVYRDLERIPIGANFVREIEVALARCDRVIAVIGPGWADRVISNEEDFVRRELETAIQRDVAILPVLVGGVTWPPARALPERLRPLLALSAMRFDSGVDFDNHFERLAKHIPCRNRIVRWLLSAGVLLLATAAGVHFARRSPQPEQVRNGIPSAIARQLGLPPPGRVTVVPPAGPTSAAPVPRGSSSRSTPPVRVRKAREVDPLGLMAAGDQQDIELAAKQVGRGGK